MLTLFRGAVGLLLLSAVALPAKAAIPPGSPPLSPAAPLSPGPASVRASAAEFTRQIAEMLPLAVPGLLPHGATIATVSVRDAEIRVRVALPPGDLGFVLRPRRGPAPPVEPARFELTTAGPLDARGTAVRAALVDLIRAREGGVRWPAAAQLAGVPPQAETEPPDLAARLARIGDLLARADAAAHGETASLTRDLPPERAGPHAAWQLATLWLRQQRPAEAEPYLRRLTATPMDPGLPLAPDLWRHRAAAAWALDRAADADAVLAACRRQHGPDAAGCSHRDTARVAAWSGRLPAAAALLDRELGDGSRADLDLLVLRLGLARRLADAAGEARLADLARTRFAHEAEAWLAWAEASVQSGRFDEAVRAYEAAWRRDPRRPGTLGALGDAFQLWGHAARTAAAGAHAHYETRLAALRRRAGHADAHLERYLLATAAFARADFEQAIEGFAALEPTWPAEPRLATQLALAHAWLGRQAEAERHVQRAVRLGPADPDVYEARARITFRHRPRQAVADLRRALALHEVRGSDRPATRGRLRALVQALVQGEVPAQWAHFEADVGQGPPAAGWLALGLVAVLGWAVLWRRRREARA